MRHALILSSVSVFALGCTPPSTTPKPDEIPVWAGVSRDAVDRAEVLRLMGGVNRVDIDDDGKLDVITVGWRENNNAHGHTVYSFLRHSPADSAIGRDWQVIPFEDSTGLQDVFLSGGGADCVLSDLRVLRDSAPKTAGLIVVTAVRDFGDNYADSARVTFKTFHLVTNPDGAVGWPDKYFKAVRTTRSARRYCDVGDAFSAEMGVPPRDPRE